MAKNPGKVVSHYSFSTVFCSAWMKAMTIRNIVAGFKVCGIYPLNRDAIKVPKLKSIEKLSEESGLPFIPMLSPDRQEKNSTSNFSLQEIKKFKRRYENNYDLQDDHRYNAWLRRYHPKSSDVEEDMTVSFLKPYTPGSVSPDLPSTVVHSLVNHCPFVVQGHHIVVLHLVHEYEFEEMYPLHHHHQQQHNNPIMFRC